MKCRATKGPSQGWLDNTESRSRVDLIYVVFTDIPSRAIYSQIARFVGLTLGQRWADRRDVGTTLAQPTLQWVEDSLYQACMHGYQEWRCTTCRARCTVPFHVCIYYLIGPWETWKWFYKCIFLLILQIDILSNTCVMPQNCAYDKSNIGSSDVLVTLGNKPITESMSTYDLCHYMTSPSHIKLRECIGYNCGRYTNLFFQFQKVEVNFNI